jgi:hypothetical protein
MLKEEATVTMGGPESSVDVKDMAEKAELPNVFSTNRPRNLLDGAMSGVGNILTGTLSGLAVMVAAPVQGAMEGSKKQGAAGAVTGGLLGLGKGLVAGSALAVGGALTGIYQVGRGIVNTKDEVEAKFTRKDWDSESRSWVKLNLGMVSHFCSSSRFLNIQYSFAFDDDVTVRPS